MKFIYGMLLYFILSSSCKKDLIPTIIEGQAIDITTGEPVPNANIRILTEHRSKNEGVARFKTIKADQNGNISYSFDADPDLQYELYGFIDWIYLVNYVSSARIYAGNTQKVKVNMYPGAYLRVNLNFNDSIDLPESFYMGIRFENYWPISNLYQEKANIAIYKPIRDTSFLLFGGGNSKNQYSYRANYNAQKFSVKKDSLFLKAIDTTVLNIDL